MNICLCALFLRPLPCPKNNNKSQEQSVLRSASKNREKNMDRLKEVLAFVNNKGGVGKTTTVQNVAFGLLRRDSSLRVLCIDLDPQGNLSTLLGWREKQKHYSNPLTVADVMRRGDDSRLPVYGFGGGLFYVPASSLLSDIEPDLHRQMQSKLVLSDLFGNGVRYMDSGSDVKEERIEESFDYILIDCAPALSELTYNALGAATGVVIPVQLGSLSVDGIGRMVEAYRNVRRRLNKELELRGLLIVMADERTNLSRETSDYLRNLYDDAVFRTRIRQCVKVGESQFHHQSIFEYAPSCTAARDYEDFIEELLETV